MRGKAVFFRKQWHKGRITPAYAGKSSRLVIIPFNARDHPRLCGEKQQQQDIVRWIPGSPPPMRGKVKIPL